MDEMAQIYREFEAIETLARLLAPLDGPARSRIMEYVFELLGTSWIRIHEGEPLSAEQLERRLGLERVPGLPPTGEDR